MFRSIDKCLYRFEQTCHFFPQRFHVLHTESYDVDLGYWILEYSVAILAP